ncbi:hypothetical protein ANN_09927 [Periplaneta americana]|uniref:Uncharacterized protein n=1 Tax=Periplaneta americana TaxID=6978 RepID=A0ABQ8TPY7_PERAM|nr:hypothetical protein ANN_09927 [Periplaneta americana]
MVGLCEGGNEPPGSLKASNCSLVQLLRARSTALRKACSDSETTENSRKLLFRNNTVPTPSCSLAQLLRASSTALRKACSDSETTENSRNPFR